MLLNSTDPSAQALEAVVHSTTGLVADRALLGRASTAERVAGILRARISTGYFLPGARLVEAEITEALGISRNTLREAFRLLTHERLLAHHLNRGVFVRVLDVEEVKDLYRVRKYVECAVVRAITAPVDVSRIVEAVEQSERALHDQDWPALGTANIRFHQTIAALAGSVRINELMDGVLAELRLVLPVMTDPGLFYKPYLTCTREIVTALADGDGARAEQLLYTYLDDAEQQLVKACAQRTAERPDPSTAS